MFYLEPSITVKYKLSAITTLSDRYNFSLLPKNKLHTKRREDIRKLERMKFTKGFMRVNKNSTISAKSDFQQTL